MSKDQGGPSTLVCVTLRTRGTVLLVDDNDKVLASLSFGLKAYGFTVLTTRNGGEALELLRTDVKVDLLLSDVVMDGISGIDLARASRVLRPSLPVLLMTGYTFEMLVQLGARKHEFCVILKPCPIKNLATRIAQMLLYRAVQ